MTTLLYGDSSIAKLEHKNFTVESYPGCTSEDLLKSDLGLDYLLRTETYENVVISVGHNDLKQHFSITDVIINIELLISICKDHECVKKIIFVLPAKQPEFNLQVLEMMTDDIILNEFLIETMDFEEDKLHLTEEGHKKFVESLLLDLA
jgi:lysophospholipase L1-like esterase